MPNPTNDAYKAKSPLVFRPARTSAAPGKPVPLADLEELAAETVIGAAAAGAPVAITLGDSLALTGSTLDIADGSKGDVVASKAGADWTIGDGVVTEAKQVLADNTTHNVSAARHGYAPKLPNDATKFLCGDGTWKVP